MILYFCVLLTIRVGGWIKELAATSVIALLHVIF